MKSRLLLTLVAVVAIVAMTVGGTLAYFSDTKTEQLNVTTLTVAVDNTSGFPLNFTGLLPGTPATQDVAIQNTGSAAADFYVQLVGTGSGPNYCFDTSPGPWPAWIFRPVLSLVITELDTATVRYNDNACNLYPGQSTSIIPLLSDDVPAGGVRNIRATLTLTGAAGNSFQGQTKSDGINIIAVQYNGPAPVPSTIGFPGTAGTPWTTDANYLP